MSLRRADDATCAEPGCRAPCARGSYCAEHGAIYYERPKGAPKPGSWVDRLGDGGLSPSMGNAIPLNDDDDDVVRQVRAKRRARAAA